MHHSKIIALIIAIIIGICHVSAQDVAPMTVTAKADSTTLIMGDRTSVVVEVLKNTHNGALITMPEKGKDYYGMEMVDCQTDSADLGNNRVQLKYLLTFQAFDPAEILTLPPFVYAANGDTVKSDILTFRVLPVELSPELGDPTQPDSLTIHPYEPVIAVQSKWYDYIPDWTIWVLIGALVIAIGVVLWILYRKNGPGIFVPKKPIPPYELAIQRLNALKGKRLIENGMAKQFYTEVTDIWRQYLEGRFGISAMEMTSSQILKQLRANKETHLSAGQMEELLRLSDFVKFAAMNPTTDEMVNTYNTIYSFIESTRPQPEPDEEANKTKTEKKK